MKRILSMILASIMSMYLFAGCTERTNNRIDNNKKIKIGVCISNLNDKFMSYLIKEMKDYAQSLNNVEIEYVDAKIDSNTQLAQVENFISEGVDVLAVNPVDSNSTKSISDKANAAGIPIVSFNNNFEDSNDVVCSVDSDLKQSGLLQMESLAKKVNYKGNVAIIMGIMGQQGQRLRTQAIREIVAKHPDMKIVAEQTAGWNRAKGMALMESWIESGKDIDVVACEDDEMAIGALEAIEQSGKLGKITVGGIDATPDGLDYLKNGKLSVTVFPNATDQSKAVLDNAIKVASGEKVEKEVNFPNELVTSENVEQYIAKWQNK